MFLQDSSYEHVQSLICLTLPTCYRSVKCHGKANIAMETFRINSQNKACVQNGGSRAKQEVGLHRTLPAHHGELCQELDDYPQSLSFSIRVTEGLVIKQILSDRPGVRFEILHHYQVMSFMLVQGPRFEELAHFHVSPLHQLNICLA